MSNLILVCMLLVCVTSVGAGCPDGWYGYQKNCYFLNKDKQNWETAKKYCSSVGAHLARIETEGENQFLKRIFIGKTTYTWIDGTDKQKEGEWIWSSTNKPIVYTNWAPKEPNSKIQDGLAFLADFKWDDGTMTHKDMSICELDDKNEDNVCHCSCSSSFEKI